MAVDALEIVQGTLDVLVLRALKARPLHGYGIARFIDNSSEGRIRVIDGALYTALHRMEDRGWVKSDWGRSEKGKRAKFYYLTTAGHRAFRREAGCWQDYVTAVSKVLAPEG